MGKCLEVWPCLVWQRGSVCRCTVGMSKQCVCECVNVCDCVSVYACKCMWVSVCVGIFVYECVVVSLCVSGRVSCMCVH